MSGETGVDRGALIDAIYDRLSDNDVGCGPWCNDQRGACQGIRQTAADVAAEAVLALLPAPHADYPLMPEGATVETLWKSLNDLHVYAMEAIAAEKACAAAATEAHINGVCAPAPHPQDGTEALIATLRHVTLCPVESFACTAPLHAYAVSVLHDDALLAAAPAPTEAGSE